MHPKLKKTIFLLAIAFVAALGVKAYMARLAQDNVLPLGAGPDPDIDEDIGVVVDTPLSEEAGLPQGVDAFDFPAEGEPKPAEEGDAAGDGEAAHEAQPESEDSEP